MRKLLTLLICIFLCASLAGCSGKEAVQVAATTLPIYEFTSLLCQGTDITVTRLITENVSCLHDYSLQVRQMQIIEQADMVVISGAGLEDFLDDSLHSAKNLVDASAGITLLCEDTDHHHGHDGHSHNQDPHIWLSPENAEKMAHNICQGLIEAYPQQRDLFSQNLSKLVEKIRELQSYADNQLADLTQRELITFHDGFAYLAEAFDLTILHAIEEESGSEASAAELIDLINIVSQHGIRTIFTEKNGSAAAASVVAAETDVSVFDLDMALSGDSYFTAMYHNIDTLKEALK